MAAAVFGSHVYTRFSPSILKPLLDTTVPIESLIRHLRSDWDERVVRRFASIRLCVYASIHGRVSAVGTF